MTLSRSLLLLAGTSSLAVFLNCNGGGGGSDTATPAATSFSYTDPTSGTWQLKKDASSTSTHLVLNLVAVSPAAGSGNGVAASFTVDSARATWSFVTPGDNPEYVHAGSVLNLGSGTKALRGKVTAGTVQFAVSQKGTGSPVALNGPVAQIALDLKGGVTPGAITLTAVAGKTKVLDNTNTVGDITVTVGTLTAQ